MKNELTRALELQLLKREAVGKLIIENNRGKQFCMNNVILAPDLVANLLSVRQLRINGYDLIFGDTIKIIRQDDDEVVANVKDGWFVYCEIQFNS